MNTLERMKFVKYEDFKKAEALVQEIDDLKSFSEKLEEFDTDPIVRITFTFKSGYSQRGSSVKGFCAEEMLKHVKTYVDNKLKNLDKNLEKI